MLDLDRALTDIRAMRSQIARGTEFRGYGPAAFAARCSNLPAPGALRATGGPPTPGLATNGTSPSATALSTASFAVRAAGSWREAMTEKQSAISV